MFGAGHGRLAKLSKKCVSVLPFTFSSSHSFTFALSHFLSPSSALLATQRHPLFYAGAAKFLLVQDKIKTPIEVTLRHL